MTKWMDSYHGIKNDNENVVSDATLNNVNSQSDFSIFNLVRVIIWQGAGINVEVLSLAMRQRRILYGEP